MILWNILNTVLIIMLTIEVSWLRALVRRNEQRLPSPIKETLVPDNRVYQHSARTMWGD